MERIGAFDLLIFLALFAMFILGYAQGLVRRLLGLAAIVFSLFLAAQLRGALGGYLAGEWAALLPSYGYMIAFGTIFVASSVTLSIAIQITYRPAPLLTRYPVLDEILGGVVGVVEGLVILVAMVLVLDPYYTLPAVRTTIGAGEFGLLRTVHDFLDPSLTADLLRHVVIPPILSLIGWLFPADVVETFTAVVVAAR